MGDKSNYILISYMNGIVEEDVFESVGKSKL